MNYPISYPFAPIAQMLGAKVIIRFDVIKDDDAGVFVATSPDVKGLIVEADTFEQLQAEIADLLPEFIPHSKPTQKASASFSLYTGIRFA